MRHEPGCFYYPGEKTTGDCSCGDPDIQLCLATIEEMAEERHLLHSSIGKGDRFWGCSRPCCKKVSEFLRGKRKEEATRSDIG